MATPVKIAEIDHVVFRCREQAKMLDFYTRLLGLKEERRIEQIGLIQLRAGSAMIDLVASDLVPSDLVPSGPAPSASAAQAKSINVDHVCLGIETRDLSGIAAYLKANAVEVIGEPSTRYGARGMGFSIYVRDPEGNVIELKQMPIDARR